MTKNLIPLLTCFLLLTSCHQSTKHDNASSTSVDTLDTFKEFVPELINKDSATLAYIHTQNEYVELVDKVKLPELVRIYYPCILDFLYKNSMDKNNYYVDTTGIGDSSLVILIPIYHYNGFIVAKELEDENKQLELDSKKNGTPAFYKVINGNLSGHDGFLKIDKKTKKVLVFGIWI